MNNKIKIAIVDDVPLFVDGLSMIFEHDPELKVVYTANNGAQLLEELAKNPNMIDIILLDLEMPILDGIEALRVILQKEYPAKVIILTSHYNDGMIIKILDEGAAGFLAKNEKPDEVIETIKKVYNRGFYINNHIFQLIRNRRLHSSRKLLNPILSKREIEVLKLICLEKTNKEIADKLNISIRTVEGHRQNIILKTDCKNTVGLVIYAIEHQYIDVSISRYH